jgi:hypothetical protein
MQYERVHICEVGGIKLCLYSGYGYNETLYIFCEVEAMKPNAFAEYKE